MLVVAAAPACSEVVGADDAVGGQDHGAGGEAEIIGVIRDRTPHTAHQATCHQTATAQSASLSYSFLLFTPLFPTKTTLHSYLSSKLTLEKEADL